MAAPISSARRARPLDQLLVGSEAPPVRGSVARPGAVHGLAAGAIRRFLVGGLRAASLGALAALALAATPDLARARASAGAAGISQSRVLPYPMDQVWTTAVRYLRVDRGYEVLDASAEAGYILFRFPVGGPGGRTGDGSLEAFATRDAAGRPSVQVKVTTGAGPVHLPFTLLDGLAAKIRAERGQPPAPPPAAPAPEPDDPPPDRDAPEG